MITTKEILRKSEELGVSATNVQRDYVFGWLLASIYGSSTLAPSLVLKGGNALRKAYFPGTRFSDDLDFSAPRGLGAYDLLTELNDTCRIAGSQSGVEYDLERNRVVNEQRIDSGAIVHKLRLYFRDFSGQESPLTLKVRLDVAEFDRLRLPVQTRSLIHPYSDLPQCGAQIRCVKLEEALADKLICLLQRRYAYDLFDLVYCIFISNEIAVDRRQVITTFLQKTVFQSSPQAAKSLLSGLVFDPVRGFWDRIVCPAATHFSFDHAVSVLQSGLESLFTDFTSGAGRFGACFRPELRNVIIEAAQNHTLLRLTYQGRTRLVEPYSLVFKVRRASDGVAQEYFYGYDQTGGTSGPGIKTFVQANVDHMESTAEPFVPRFPIELTKEEEGESTLVAGPRPFVAQELGAVARRGVHLRRRTSTSTSIYTLKCSYCGKTFKRTKRGSTKLNPHSNGYGSPCYGRVGYWV
jgi:predicted nucleotidyltransferase component of viral defense system